MNRCQRPSPLAGLPIAWLLLVAPVSAGDVTGPLHDDGNAQHGDSHDQQNPQQETDHLMYAEHDGDPDISRKLTADQRRRNEEEKQRDLASERQDSRERSDDASRYYWWWPFRR